MVYSRSQGCPQLLHHIHHHNRGRKEEEGDEAVGEQLAGVYPARRRHHIVQGVPRAEGDQSENEHPAQRGGEGVDQQFDEVADVIGNPAIDALHNDGDGEQRPVYRPQQLCQHILQKVNRLRKVAAGV